MNTDPAVTHPGGGGIGCFQAGGLLDRQDPGLRYAAYRPTEGVQISAMKSIVALDDHVYVAIGLTAGRPCAGAVGVSHVADGNGLSVRLT